MKLKRWISDKLKNRMYNEVSYLLGNSTKEEGKKDIVILGNKYYQFPDVFPIDKFLDTNFFTNAISITENEKFLEIGVGTGVTSIVAAKKGAIVTGVDINENAIKSSILNAKRNFVEKRTNFFISDIFSNVKEKDYDTIYWNVPFCYSEKKTLSKIERSVFDYKYTSLRSYILQSSSYLKSGGRLLIGYSNIWGIPEKLVQFIYQSDYSVIRITAQTYVEWHSMEFDLTLYELKK